MGNKINATAFRLGIHRSWSSSWFAKNDKFVKYLLEDTKIREYMDKKVSAAGLDLIEIRRPAGKTIVIVYVARPGVVIGRHGTDIEAMKKELEKIVGANVDLRVKEVKSPDLSARIIARSIADGIGKRQPPKPLVAMHIKKVMQAGAIGVSVWVSGRIRGHKDARRLKFSEGSVPMQTIRANIEFANETVQYPGAGTTSVKVWINKKP